MCRKPDQKVRKWSRQIAEFSVSVITVDEISFGLYREKLFDRIKWFEGFVGDSCQVIPIDRKVALRAGEIRGRFASKGITRSQADMLIAATSWAHGYTLATRNTRDFEGAGIAIFNPFE